MAQLRLPCPAFYEQRMNRLANTTNTANTTTSTATGCPTDPVSLRLALEVDEEKYLSGLDIILEYINYSSRCPDLQAVSTQAKAWVDHYHDNSNPLFCGHLGDVRRAHPDLFDLQVPSWLRLDNFTATAFSGHVPGWRLAESASLVAYARRMLRAHGVDSERQKRARERNRRDQYAFQRTPIVAVDLRQSPILYHIPEVVGRIAQLK